MRKVRRFRCDGHDKWVKVFGSEEGCLRVLSELGVRQSKTYFAYSKISLTTWFAALWDMAATQGKVTAVELSERYGVEIKAAQRMAEKLRKDVYVCRCESGFIIEISPEMRLAWDRNKTHWRGGLSRLQRHAARSVNRYPTKVVAFAEAVRSDPELSLAFPMVLTARIKRLLRRIAEGQPIDPKLAALVVRGIDKYTRYEPDPNDSPEAVARRRSVATLATSLRDRVIPAVIANGTAVHGNTTKRMEAG